MEWNGVVRIFEYELNIAFEHSSYSASSLIIHSLVLSLVLWFLLFDLRLPFFLTSNTTTTFTVPNISKSTKQTAILPNHPYMFIACMFYFGHLTAALRNDFCPMQAVVVVVILLASTHINHVAWMLHNQLLKESRPIPDRRPLELGRNGISLSTDCSDPDTEVDYLDEGFRWVTTDSRFSDTLNSFTVDLLSSR
jgi:hypothetical protein